MRIKEIKLQKFKKFKINEISELHALLDNQIQIIIGTNGCGKTSLLTQLFPHAHNKDLFENGGGERLVVEKDNDEYELVYSKQNNKKIHSFLKNGEELNETKTFNIQNELIERYLINPILRDILTCSINISDMIFSKRKQLILNLNPVDLSPIIDSHKNVKSYLGKLKNNLSMLYDRKTRLTQTKLSEEETKLIISNKNRLEKEERDLLTESIRVDTFIRDLKTNNKSLLENEIDISDQFFLDMIEYIKDLNLRLDRFYSLDSNEVYYKIQSHSSLIDSLTIENSNLLNKIEENIKELGHKEDLLKLSSKETSILDIENEIRNLIIEKKRIESLKLDYDILFTEIDMEKYPNVKDKLINLINNFLTIFNKPILNSDTLNKIRRRLDNISSLITLNNSYFNISKDGLNKANNELSKINNSNIDSLPNSCEKDVCFLFKNAFGNKKELEVKIKEFNNQILKHQEIINRLTKAYSTLNTFYSNQISYHPYIKEIKDIFNNNPIFNSIIQKEEFFWFLNNNPFGIINKLDQAYNLSVNYFYKEKIEKRIDELKKEYLTIKELTKTSSDLIISLILETKNQIDRIKNKLENNEKKIKVNQNRKNLYHEFSKELTLIKERIDLVSRACQYTEITKSIEFGEAYLTLLGENLNITRKTLFTINEKIKEQEYINVRLTEEIIKPIKELEDKKKDYEILEIGLHKLTLEYIENFIGNIINNMNYFINKVFTYPLEIKQIDGLSDINFKFKIEVNDVLVEDINECSKGQKAIINLAFCLALILELDLVNNPLYVDECDSFLDTAHQQRLVELFTFLIDNNIVSQIFATFHSLIISENLSGDVIVINDNNITLPMLYNTNVTIKKE